MIGWALKLLPLLKSHWKLMLVILLALFLSGYNLHLRRQVLKGQLEVSERDARISTLRASLSVQNASIEALGRELDVQKARTLKAREKARQTLVSADKRVRAVLERQDSSDSLTEAVTGLFGDLEGYDWRNQ